MAKITLKVYFCLLYISVSLVDANNDHFRKHCFTNVVPYKRAGNCLNVKLSELDSKYIHAANRNTTTQKHINIASFFQNQTKNKNKQTVKALCEKISSYFEINECWFIDTAKLTLRVDSFELIYK